MVEDPDNDGKKCPFKPGDQRTFKLAGGKANLETCTKACADNSACVAFSAQFGKWCIGCKEALSDKHAGAKAFKKSGQGGDGDGGDNNNDNNDKGKESAKEDEKGAVATKDDSKLQQLYDTW